MILSLIEVPGFIQLRKIWCKLNRLRMGIGRCNSMLFKWNVIAGPACDCGAEIETVKHIIDECSLAKFEFGFTDLHNLTPEAVAWILTTKDL